MISGGLHAGGNLDFQDFLLIPVGAKTYSEALAMAVRVYHELGGVLEAHHEEGVLVGDEGGYGPKLKADSFGALYLTEAIEAAGRRPGSDAAIALDVASTHFFDRGSATYQLRDRRERGEPPASSLEMTQYLAELVERYDYPIVSIEDGCAEDDW